MTARPPDGPLADWLLWSKEHLTRSRVMAYGAAEVLIGKAAAEQHRLRAERSPLTRAAVEAAARIDAYGQVAADALNLCGTKEGFLAAVRGALDAYPAPAPPPGTAGYDAWRAAVTQAVLRALGAQAHTASASAGGGAGRTGPAPAQRVTVTVWHNVAVDAHGQPAAAPDGCQPGDPLVRVFAYQADPAGRTPDQLARDALAAFSGRPADPDDADLAWAYRERRLRPLAHGDVVAVAGTPLTVTKNGLAPVPAPLTEVRTREHGTLPLLPARSRRAATAAPDREHEAT